MWKVLLSAGQSVSSTDNLGNLLRNFGLTCVVCQTGVVADELVSVVAGRLHRALTAGVLRRSRLEHRVVDAAFDVHRKECIENSVGLGLELVQRKHVVLTGDVNTVDNFERQNANNLGNLAHHVDEAVVDDVDFIHATLACVTEERIYDLLTDLLSGLENGSVSAAGPGTDARAVAEAEVRAGLATDEVVDHVFALLAQEFSELLRLAHDVRAERAGETAVRGEDDDRGALDLLRLGGFDEIGAPVERFVDARVLVRLPMGDRQALMVPASALMSRAGLDFVQVDSAAGPALRTVVPGQPRATADGPMVEILSGLVAGDRVVTDPAPTTGAGADHE